MTNEQNTDAPGTQPPLELIVPTLELDGAQADQGLLSRARHIRVVADTVVVRGHFRLPGATLTITARDIVAEDGTLDVTGHTGESFDSEAADPALDGSPASPDGKPGAPGGPGERGGTLELYAGAVHGSLTLVANGGRGGNAQRGGNGAKPAAANGRDGAFIAREEPTGVYGAKTIQTRGLRSYVTMATGEPGGDARPGGNAGASGRPGDGGDGGRIVVRVLESPTAPVACTVEAGPPGAPAPDATPGPPGDPGQGGRNRVYLYNWFKGFNNEDWADGKNKHINGWKLDARAASGKACTQPGQVPAAPEADPGQPGGVDVQDAAADMQEWIAFWRADDLQWLLGLSSEERPQADATIAQARLRWLADVTEGATEPRWAALHALAVNGVKSAFKPGA